SDCYTLSLHDALPICWPRIRKTTGKAACRCRACAAWCRDLTVCAIADSTRRVARSIAKRQDSTPASYSTNAIISTASFIRCGCRSEEHTSELQSLRHL